MEHFVGLESLPSGLTFPPEFCSRLRFEPETKPLVHVGFMSKAEFDRLCQLSGDWAYRRSLEELFRRCAVDDEPKPRGIRRLVSALTSWMG
jgi:hypothetical protein